MCDQARAIRKNGWLSELELEAIKRQVEAESQQDVNVEAETVETDVGTVEEETNEAEDSISNTKGDLNENIRRLLNS